MNLDLKLTKLGLRVKNFIVLDLSFPQSAFPEFKKAYEKRYLHFPHRGEMVMGIAAGLSSFGKVVLIYGSRMVDCDVPDQTANVKLLRHYQDAVWDYFEEELLEFGPSVLLIPEEE